jgi:hypothetical protein
VDVDHPPVEEVLVLRVVSAAHRRRVRRVVVAALLAIVAGGGTAIGLTHRSDAPPAAVGAPPAVVPQGPAVGIDPHTRAQIYAAVRARYASALDSARHRSYLRFGRLTVHGDRATLQVNVICVPLCGHGDALILHRADDQWRVVAVRPTWVS